MANRPIGAEDSPEFLKTETTEGDFEQAGKQEVVRHLLYRLENRSTRTIAGTPSSQHSLWGLSLEMIETIDSYMYIT